jgi:hypothetical protein
VGRRARPAPELQDAHALLRLQQDIFHLVVVAEGRAREHARAVVHVDVAGGAEHVVISSVCLGGSCFAQNREKFVHGILMAG